MDKENRLFISYADEDLNTVQLIDMILILNNVQSDYWDKSKVPGERDWEQIKSWIERDRYFTVILTKNAMTSSPVGQEIGFAMHAKSQIIPFQLERVDPRDLGVLQGIAPIDVTRNELTRGAEDIARAIRSRETGYLLGRVVRQIKENLTQQALEEQQRKESAIFWGGVATGVIAAVLIWLIMPKKK